MRQESQVFLSHKLDRKMSKRKLNKRDRKCETKRPVPLVSKGEIE